MRDTYPIWTYNDFEKVILGLVEENPGIMKYEVVKECVKGNMAERKVKMCIEYLLKKGMIKQTRDRYVAFELNKDYKKSMATGKPCPLC